MPNSQSGTSQRPACARQLIWLVLCFGAFLFSATLNWSQQSAGAIAGVVKDGSGAAIAGVTVEAKSPALIDKVRTTTTDQNGEYRLVDLYPGEYSITFTMQGFQKYTQDGITLTQGFTAPVSPVLKIGTAVEQVEVTEASPIIDVESTLQNDVELRQQVTDVPTFESPVAVAQLVPGAYVPAGSQDVGGSSFVASARMIAHGGTQTDMQMMVDGLDVTSMATGGPGTTGDLTPEGEIESMNVQVGSEPADIEANGVITNVIPRTGGNQFHGGVYYNFTNNDLESSNLTAALQAQGLNSTTSVKQLYSVSPAIGGPIIKDKLWFFIGAEHTVSQDYVASEYYNKSTDPFIYTADTTRPGLNDHHSDGANIRFTSQLSQKNRVNFYYGYSYLCDCHLGISGTESPEVADRVRQKYQNFQATWTSVLTPKLLYQLGWGREATVPFIFGPSPGAVLAVTDSGTGFSWGGAAPTSYTFMNSWDNDIKTSLSYTTGKHALQVGAEAKLEAQDNYSVPMPLGPIIYTLKNGVPSSVTAYPGPENMSEHVFPNMGIFAQDKWTVKSHLTLNLGLRFDMLRSTYLASTDPIATLRPTAYNTPGGTVLNWKDLDPRLGAAYDLFGKGKTALKVNYSRYVEQQEFTLTTSVNPAIASQGSETRTWNPSSAEMGVTGANLLTAGPNGGPMCNTTTGANCILGKSNNSSFGSPDTITTNIDPNYASGFEVRPYQWEFSAGVQQQILPGIAVLANFVRRSYGNIQVTDNLAANSPSDWNPYCVTAPTDSRLPNGGGYQICGLYDIAPSPVYGAPTNNLVTSATRLGGTDTSIWRGYDFLLDMRLHGILVNGGFDTGTAITNTCGIVALIGNPSPLYCSQQTPYLGSFRMNGIYPLPWKFQVSAAFQSNPGPNITAADAFSSTQIAPSLGRPLSEGTNATQTVALVKPGTMYAGRANQLDFRATKKFTIKEQYHLEGDFDLYNIFNTVPTLTLNNTYGSKWQVPSILLPPRLAKFGIRFDF